MRNMRAEVGKRKRCELMQESGVGERWYDSASESELGIEIQHQRMK